MKRVVCVFALVFFTVCGVASARSLTAPTPEDFFDAQSKVYTEYAFAENPDGTYTEYWIPRSLLGEGSGITKGAIEKALEANHTVQGDTYAGDGIREADRVTAQAAVDAGTTGQDGSIVQGADINNEAGAQNVVEDFRTAEWYKTAGEAGVGNDILDTAVAEETLPSFATMAGAASGELFSAGAVVAAGVALGDGIDAVLGFPYINPFAGHEESKNAESCCGGAEGLKNEINFHPEIEFGEVRPCESSAHIPEPEGEICDFPTMFYDEVSYWIAGGEFEELSWTVEPAAAWSGYAGTQTLKRMEPCPDSWVRCSTYHEEAPEYLQHVLYFGLFAPGVEGHWLGFAAPELGPANGTKTGTLVPLKPVEELPIHPPAHVPARVKHGIIEKAKKHQTEKEKEEKIAPVPLIPPVEEPAPGTPEIPSPLNPVVPQFRPNELGTDYAAEVEAAGFPDTKIEELPDSESDPSVGPKDVVTVQPSPGTSGSPETKVKIKVNPEDAPPPEGKKGIGGPTEPGLKFPDFGVLCKGFPFGVPCWVAKTIEGWSTTGKAPVFGFNFNVKEQEIKGSFDFAKLESLMEKLRPAMIIFSTIGLVLLFYRFAKGGSPSSSSGGGGDTTEGEE